MTSSKSQKTTSQSSLGGTSRTSTVAHTISPTPSVLSNISASSCIGHDAKDCRSSIRERPFKQGYVTPEQLLKSFGRVKD
ncbi:5137_t:CDS:2 [Funneliformis mosseae]|uniref:5137_t:CDS:1 n=1 Tax=Funneliformis mosseae TaxID=27381 RepID=A0A9N8V5Z4_FUNMO|nr:5137_t:CDS:2 [Funneliformis mosseae]